MERLIRFVFQNNVLVGHEWSTQGFSQETVQYTPQEPLTPGDIAAVTSALDGSGLDAGDIDKIKKHGIPFFMIVERDDQNVNQWSRVVPDDIWQSARQRASRECKILAEANGETTAFCDLLVQSDVSVGNVGAY